MSIPRDEFDHPQDQRTPGQPPPGQPHLGQELLHEVFVAAPSAMIMVAADGIIHMANPEAEMLFGYDPGRLAGRCVEDLVPERFRDQHPLHRDAYMLQPSSRAMGAGRDLHGLRRDGTEVPIEIGLNPIGSHDGRFVLAAIIDLSQRKQLEATLRTSEERLRRIVEAAPNAMIMVGADGAIVLANAGAEALFGWTRQELVGRPIEVLVPPAARATHPAQREAFFAAPSTRAMGAGRDLFGLRRDGSEVPIEIGLNPIETPEGPCVLAAIIDITQRKQAEAQLRAALSEKETLLREIHHRVKNNMQLVSSMLSLQTNFTDAPGLREIFEECRGRVKSMALIHEKLYLGENLATIDFGEYVRELAAMLVQSYAPRGNVRLAADCAPVTLHIDAAIPAGLILNELVTNALKHGFAGERPGVLEVSLARRPDGQAELRVADDGPGLPAGFDLDSNKTLGVRVIRSLVRQIDGAVQVPAGGRATFVVHFPLS